MARRFGQVRRLPVIAIGPLAVPNHETERPTSGGVTLRACSHVVAMRLRSLEQGDTVAPFRSMQGLSGKILIAEAFTISDTRRDCL